MALLGTALVGFYILLPLDRGFWSIFVFGRPLNAAAAATLVLFGVLCVRTNGRILTHLRRRYCFLQTCYFGVLIIASVRVAAPMIALHFALLYYCTFVLNYVILLHVASRAGPKRLARLIMLVGAAAAAVGVLQAFGVSFGGYESFFLAYYNQVPNDLGTADERIYGTLGNPILFGTCMALLIPYVADVPGRWMRLSGAVLVAISATLTGSRTVLLVSIMFMLGALSVYRRRFLTGFVTATVMLALVVYSLGGLSSVLNNPRIQFIAGRLGLMDNASIIGATVGVEMRWAALAVARDEIAHEWGPSAWLFGRGQLTSESVGAKVSPDYYTVDNEFLGVFYEKGLLGLALFLAAFGDFLHGTRRARGTTLHWWAPIGLLAAGVSFNFDAYTTFNILAVGSMAITTVLVETPAPGGVRDSAIPE